LALIDGKCQHASQRRQLFRPVGGHLGFLACRMETGDIAWWRQTTAGDPYKCGRHGGRIWILASRRSARSSNSRRALIAGVKSVMVHAHRSGPIGSLPVAVILLKTESAGLVVADVPRFYMVYNISYAGFSSSAGKMSDQVGAPTTIFIGYLFLILSYAVLAFAQSVWTLLLGFLLLGFFPVLTGGVQRSLAAQLTNKGLRGGGLECWGAPRGSGRRVPLADIRSYRRIRSWCNRYLCRTDTIRRK
jgi:hypothetical protein